MQPIDQQLVIRKLEELNSGYPLGNQPWIVNDGLNAVTTMTLQEGKATFNPASGIPVKIFTNIITGEIKIFDARVFAQR